MKKIPKLFIALFFASAILSSCSSGNKTNPDFLTPISIDIPDEIKEDRELVDLVKSSEKAINEFSDNIEQLALDSKDILDTKEEDQTLMDGLKVAQLMLQFASNSSQMAETLEKFNTYVEARLSQGGINDEQQKALETVAKAFEKRINQIDEKYDEYFDEGQDK
ncbi:MAG: hypothetical protein J7L96_08960 [Bacteroidales bacterium]|nr:hypothetical protein [Bacteroidales bacterium]